MAQKGAGFSIRKRHNYPFLKINKESLSSFIFSRGRVAVILFIIIVIALAGFWANYSQYRNPRVLGVNSTWTVDPEDEVDTATINQIQSNGVDGVELERYFDKTLSDTRIPYDRSNQRQMHPRVALTTDGYMYVVFHELDNDKVWLQKFNSNGIRQWEADKEAFVSTCTKAVNSTNITAIAEYGTDVIVIAACRTGGTNDYIYAQRLNSDGETQWASDMRVNDNTTNNKRNPEVVTVGSNIYVAWGDDRSVLSTYQIYGQTLDSSGNRTIVNDTVLVNPGVDLAGPHLHKTSSNKILLSHARTDNRNIYSRQYDTSWNVEWGPNQVGVIQGAVSIVKTQFNFTVIGNTSYYFFSANYAVNFRVWGQALDSSGNKLWNGGLDLRVGYRVVPGFISAWNDGTNPYFGATGFSGANYPCGKKVDAATGAVLWGDINSNEPPLIQGTITAPHQTTMSLVYNNGYNYIFYSNLNGIYWEDIFYNRFDTNGNIDYASDRVANQDFEIANQQEVYLTKDGGGNIFAVWVDNRVAPLSDNIYAQLFDSNGNRLWSSDTLVNTSAASPSYSHPKAAVAGTDYYVSWEINGRIYMNKLNSAGVRQWADLEVPQGSTVAYNPSIAYDGTNLVVVWDDNRDLTGNNDIYFNAVSTAGVVQLGADQRVNLGIANWQIEPEIRSDGANTYVVWEDNRDSSPDIYMQGVNGSGVPQYPADIKINNNTSAFRYKPDFVMSGGNLYIVWEDSRNKASPAADIYLAGYSGDTRIFDDTQVNQTDPERKVKPKIGVSGGHLYIVWEDYRNSVTDHDIYAASFTITGIKRYLNDTRITTENGVIAENPAITLNDVYIGWDSNLEGSTNYNTYFTSGGDVFMTTGTMSGSGLIFDAGAAEVRYGNISWTATTPVNTTARFRTRSAETLADLSTATWSSYYTVSGSAVESDDLQYLEVEIDLATTDITVSPTVDNFSISYQSNQAPQVNNITIDSIDKGEVTFSYYLYDADDPTVSLSFEYWDGSTWKSSTNVTGMGTKATGNQYTSIWTAKTDLPDTVIESQIKLTADDLFAFNNIGIGYSPKFNLDTGDVEFEHIYVEIEPDSIVLEPYESTNYYATVVNELGDDVTDDCEYEWEVLDATAGSVIGTSGNRMSFRAGSTEGDYEDAIKVTATLSDLEDYDTASLGVLVLDENVDWILRPNFIRINTDMDKALRARFFTYVIMPGTGNHRQRSDTSIDITLTEKKAGTLVTYLTPRQARYFVPKKVGCYPNLIKGEFNWYGKNYIAYSSVNVGSEEIGYLPNISDVRIMRQHLHRGGNYKFYGYVYDDLDNRTGSGSVYQNYTKLRAGSYSFESISMPRTFTLLDSSIGHISPRGDMRVNEDAAYGYYPNSLRINVTFAGQSISKKIDLWVESKGERVIYLPPETPKTIYMPPLYIFHFWSYPLGRYVDQYNDRVAGYYNIEVNEEALRKLQPNEPYFKTTDNQGNYNNAFTLINTKPNRGDESQSVGMVIDDKYKIDPCTGGTEEEEDEDEEKKEDEDEEGLFRFFDMPNWLRFLIGLLLSIPLLLNLINLIWSVTGLRKSARGIVYDFASKKPLSLAMVQVFKAKNNRQVQRVFTNKQGEFNFLLPPGEYYLNVRKNGYKPHEFISFEYHRMTDSGRDDGYYDSLYFPEEIVISEGNSAEENSKLSIPMDNIEEGFSLRRLLGSIYSFFRKYALAFLIAGTVFSVLFILAKPKDAINIALCIYYVILWIIQIYFFVAFKSGVGKVVDSRGKPVALALARLSNGGGSLVEAVVSDKMGQIAFNVPKGVYKLSVRKPGYKENKITLDLSRGISKKFEVKLEESLNLDTKEKPKGDKK